METKKWKFSRNNFEFVELSKSDAENKSLKVLLLSLLVILIGKVFEGGWLNFKWNFAQIFSANFGIYCAAGMNSAN